MVADAFPSQNPTGTAPYFRDTSVSPAVAISESTAIATYILTVYSAGAEGTRMVRTPGDPDYAQYLEWYHFANGSLQPSMSRQMTMQFAGVSLGHFQLRLANQLRMVDSHLVKNKWFAGEEVSAADCMIMFSLSTFRGFSPLDLTPYPNILRWMRDVAARPAYQRALAKGDQGMEPMIEAKVRKFTQFEAFRASLEKVVL